VRHSGTGEEADMVLVLVLCVPQMVCLQSTVNVGLHCAVKLLSSDIGDIRDGVLPKRQTELK